ncbi:MAG TPA: TonB-dependent receptor [Bacteroidales bacterium]|nr:TonB-dependent receptor [Bacteroidales bacterium]HQH23911.1 TonB-dependent receptor [Bacteroidales bacterium]HQJ81241.1 TonB-dependent receptor [Bacteroidales bacterium]
MKRILMFSTLLLITVTLVMAQTVQITGTVTGSEDGLPLPGVNVTVKGTTIGSITGADGKYVLSLPVSAQTLVFSFIGFVTQEVPIQGRTDINVVLKQDLYNVDEVVVVAYGTVQKRDITGSVSSVKADAIRNIPVQSFDQALQGKAAGVSITMPSGALNNPPVIRIRGFNSITGSSSPLIVVDGVPIFSGDVSQTYSFANALSDINPSDIESMDILKDASATALYGSRAANGVIIITTKRGTGAKTNVTYDGYVGYTAPYHLFDLMNAQQYLSLKNKALANSGSSTVLKYASGADGKNIDTDWADFVYQKGFQHNHAITFSGSTPSTSYFLSVGYTNQEGMIRKSSFTRKNARLNIDHKLNKWVTLAANIAYTNGYNVSPNTGSDFSTAGAARLAFVLPSILGPYKADGSYNINGAAIGTMGTGLTGVSYYNPAAIIDLCKFTNETDRVLATLSGSLEPIKGLTLKTVYGIDNLSSESVEFRTPLTGDGYSDNGSVWNSFYRPKRWTWTNTLNYNISLLEKFNFGFLAGAEEQYTKSVQWTASKYDVADPFFTVYQGSWVEPELGGGVIGENYFISYFGRFNFNYNRKYYLEGSVRRDAFSGLSKDNKWGTFGGASVMWNASNEQFISDAIGSVFSDIRLKASFGRVGNMSGIGNFSSLYLYGAGLYADVPTLAFSQIGNSALKWETSDKYDAGLSFGLLDDKIQAEINWYYNNVNGLILDVQQTPSKGIPGGTIPQNIGSMFNTGFELTLTSYNFSTPRFSWTTTLNFSTLKNEVKALAPGIDYLVGTTGGLETTNRTVVGEPIGNLFAVETRGVDPQSGRRIFVNKDGKEITYSHENPAATRWNYRDGSGVAPQITLAGDGKIMGSPLPKYFGGLDNNLTYLGFDMTLNLTYAFDFDLYCGSKAGLRDQRFWNNSVEVFETAWEKPGDKTNIPKPVWGDNVSNGSAIPISENIERGDFVKVRTVSAGYTFKSLPAITKIEKIRIYAQLFNAFVFTKYSGSDPEVSTNRDANLTPGVDRNTAPQARTWTFGLSVNF